ENAASVRGGRGLRRMDPGRGFERDGRARRGSAQALNGVDELWALEAIEVGIDRCYVWIRAKQTIGRRELPSLTMGNHPAKPGNSSQSRAPRTGDVSGPSLF